MAFGMFRVPRIGTGTLEPTLDAFRPKYFGRGESLALAPGQADWINVGKEPWFIVIANVTAAQRTTLAGFSDVLAVPANLDNQVGANLTTVQAALEEADFPAQWVTAVMTWRSFARRLWFLALFRQAIFGTDSTAPRFFSGGITLDSTVGDLTVAQRTRLQTAAARLAAQYRVTLDLSGIVLATTLRSALVQVGQQFPNPLTYFGEVL